MCMEAFIRPTQEALPGLSGEPGVVRRSPGLSGQPLRLSGEPLGLSGEPVGLSGEPLGLSGELLGCPAGLPRALLIGFRLEGICQPDKGFMLATPISTAEFSDTCAWRLVYGPHKRPDRFVRRTLGFSPEALGLSGEPLGLSGEPLGLSGEPLGLSASTFDRV